MIQDCILLHLTINNQSTTPSAAGTGALIGTYGEFLGVKRVKLATRVLSGALIGGSGVYMWWASGYGLSDFSGDTFLLYPFSN